MFPSLQNALEKNGVASEGAQKIVAVPADPSEILDTKPKVIKLFETAGRNFWIRRHEFNRILLGKPCCIIYNATLCFSFRIDSNFYYILFSLSLSLSFEDECAKEKEIEIVNGIVCKSLGPASDGLEEITVCADQSGNNKEFKASLVIASDGMNSVVRNCLNQSPSPFPGWENNEPSGFKPRRWLYV
jgi:2-polyprenyl-6-methoxyphenol hydroxylase-like FAD-dependent oxidoreductase